MEAYFKFRFIMDVIGYIIGGLVIVGYIIYLVIMFFQETRKDK